MSEYTRGCYCPTCGREIDKDETICHACGASLGTPSGSGSKKSGYAKWYHVLQNPTIFSVITAALSLLLIIFAFCPFISVKTTYNEKSSYDTSFSPVEIIECAAKSFTYYSSEKSLAKSDEYKNFEKAYKKVEGISFTKKLSSSDQKKLANFTKCAILLDLVGTENNLKFNLIAAAAATICYLVLAALAFGASVFALIKSLGGSTSVERFLLYASKKLVALALMTPIFALLLAEASRFSNGSYSQGFGNSGTSPAWGFALTLIPILTVTAYAAVKCFLKMRNNTEALAKSNAKNRLVIMVLIVASVVSIFLPAISVVCAAPKSRRSVLRETEHVSVTDIYEFSNSDMDYYSELLPNDESLIYAAESVAKDKAGEGAGAVILHSVIYSEGNLNVLYIFITIFAVLFMLLALTLLSRYVRAFLLDAPLNSPGTHLKFTIIAAVVYLALNFVLVANANSWISVDASYYILFNIGAGPICALTLSVLAFIFLRLRQEKGQTAEKFDNPDVSVAPYVIN